MNPPTATGDFTALATALAGQYEVDREIGRGGMGVVYLARDLRLDRLVAIKTLPVQLGGDSALRERFLREARTAARLSHPNIVPIHRADELGGQVFFVMGFVDGDSLAAKLKAGPLSPRDAIPVLRDVASALGYAHKHGVVHRDVKTENIMIERATGRALVTDFGIARVAEAAPLTATGQVLGTVYYLSPEQVSGDEVDARSDIYALGVVGYAMLAGKFPFEGPLASAVLVAHVMKQAAPLAVVAPNVPASLASIIDRCLAKDPANRFQSCADLDVALAAAQPDANRAIAYRPVTPLISDAEARAVFKRAAELQDMTGVQPRPVIVATRDADADARRAEGFKTSNLREAAAEAGIDEKFVERALVERGLRPLPKRQDKPERRPTNVIHDVTNKPGFLGIQPTEIHYEMVISGEAPEEDYDLLVDTIRQHWRDPGMGGMVGRTLTWSGTTPRGRQLEVTVLPRNGKTTVRVSESFKGVAGAIYGLSMGVFGGGFGGFTFGSMMAHHEPTGGALTAWAFIMGVGFLVSVAGVQGVRERRQKALKKLLEDLGAQTRASIDEKK
jgi:serine/threonine-protein kinase